MDSAEIGRVVLMSIRPEYAGAILRGEKLVEFRKRPIAGNVTHIVVYATLPVGAIIGAFTVAGQETSSPHSLWKDFGGVAGIRRDDFMEYFRSCDKGTCIRIGDVYLAQEHLQLGDAAGIRRPPQSFQYMSPESAKSLMDHMRPIDSQGSPGTFQ